MKNNSRNKRISVLLILMLVMAFVVMPAGEFDAGAGRNISFADTQDEIDQAQQDVEDIEKQQEEVQGELAEVAAKIESIKAEIDEINAVIAEKEAEINETNARNMEKKLKALGVKPAVNAVKSGDKTLYKVSIPVDADMDVNNTVLLLKDNGIESYYVF